MRGRVAVRGGDHLRVPGLFAISVLLERKGWADAESPGSEPVGPYGIFQPVAMASSR